MQYSLFARRALVGAAIMCMVLLLPRLVTIPRVASGVEVIVANKTNEEIKNLTVEFTGGITNTAAIRPGTVFRTVVRPTSESHLELRFTDAAGKERTEKIGVYFEPGYGGEVVIELAPDGTVSFEDKIYVSWLW